MSARCYKSIDFYKSPADLFAVFKDEPYPFLLESSLCGSSRGRFSFIGFDPFHVFRSDEKNAIDQLRKLYLPFKDTDPSGFFPLEAGIVGFLSYDFGMFQENIPHRIRKDMVMPEVLFGFYDCIITIDHFAKKLYISSTGWPETASRLQTRRAESRLRYVLQKMAMSLEQGQALPASKEISPAGEISPSSNFTRDQYLTAIRRAQKYIADGDIYQVNLAQRFRVSLRDLPVEGLDIYQTLRGLSPSNFSSFLDAGEFQIISSSPERFLSLEKGVAQTRPMKGTRARGKTRDEDQALRDDLDQSVKEKAELLMVTDLERNDFGRVCEYGSVRVKDMRTIEEYKTVFQATSTVEGKLRTDKDVFDLLNACFPSGSVTGCPKIRAMEIIEELEPHRRGIYTGSLGYVSFHGNADFSVLIRTILKTKSDLYFHAGGGIVADSVPEKEYEETLLKVKAILDCLRQVAGSRSYALR